jgi:ABC-2 type transport system permease protein
MTTRPSTESSGLRRPRRMSPWRLEWLRFVRSARGLALGSVYVAFGLLGPVMAKYMQDIVRRFQSSVTITVPDPTAKDGIANYISQVSQTGLVVVVVIAAGALTFDGRRGLAIFLRTRADSVWHLVIPRFAVAAAAAVAAYALGTLAAWYETVLLLGPLPWAAMVAGLLCGSTYLMFAVAAVAAAASFARTTLATVGIALGGLLVLPVAGLLEPIHRWLPSTLVTAPVGLLTGTHLIEFLPALAVAALGSGALVAIAGIRLRRREI